MLLDQQLKATLPKRDIKPFDGDPMVYATFMQAFKYGVEMKTQNDADRLYYLEQFTVGEPNKLVRSCLNNEHIQYAAVKKLLADKFGNKYRIAEAFKRKVECWPIVKGEDANALNNLALFLVECRNTMTDLEVMNEMDHAANIRLLMSKLTFGLRNKWRSLADNIEEAQGRVAGFPEFVSFVEKQARIASNPVYGQIATETDRVKGSIAQSNRRSDRNRGGISSFATNIADSSNSNTASMNGRAAA